MANMGFGLSIILVASVISVRKYQNILYLKDDSALTTEIVKALFLTEV